MRHRRDENKPMAKELADSIDASRKENWLNPIAMSQLQAAVKEQRPQVVLSGVRYNISYGHSLTFPASNETRESVKLTRADGDIVPFGYITMKRIMDFDFGKEG